MKKNVSKIVTCILFLAGLSLLLYPFLSNQWNNYRQSKLLNHYEDVVKEKETAGEIDYKAELERAKAYNAALLPSILPDSFAVANASDPSKEYMSTLNLAGDGVMGYIEIPKIKIKIPIYHTTDKARLEKGAGHLEGSSLPVGGENTHVVIAAHRGLPNAILFTDLDKMKKGDHFFLSILDQNLCYEVDKISVVEPDETDLLAVEDGKDLVTLLTCTPYGVNSHRLLVRGHRVPYEKNEKEKELTTKGTSVSMYTNHLFWVIVGLGITGIFVAFLYYLEKKKKTNGRPRRRPRTKRR